MSIWWLFPILRGLCGRGGRTEEYLDRLHLLHEFLEAIYDLRPHKAAFLQSVSGAGNEVRIEADFLVGICSADHTQQSAS